MLRIIYKWIEVIFCILIVIQANLIGKEKNDRLLFFILPNNHKEIKLEYENK